MYLLNFVLIILMQFLLLLLLENDLISSPVNVPRVQDDICAGKDNNKMQNKTKIRICVVVTASALVARFTPNNDFTKHTHTHPCVSPLISQMKCLSPCFIVFGLFFVLALCFNVNHEISAHFIWCKCIWGRFRLQDHVFSSAAVCRFVICF